MVMNDLSKLALSLVAFALVVGVGVMILVNFATSVSIDTSGSTSEQGSILPTGYTLLKSTYDSFSPTITSIQNSSAGGWTKIELANYTISPLWVITNATAFNYINATFNYTYTYKVRTDSYTNINYMKNQLGVNGLAGWAPALIAVMIGLMILGLFIGTRGRKY